jgi:A/G-specific adenine glycosylase
MDLKPSAIRSFQKKIYTYYHTHGRSLFWRTTRNPYRILVSEIMLQQTQVERVAQKYLEFIAAFPNFKALAQAPLREILQVWQGMGYNRRALFLKKIAEQVTEKYNGRLPGTADALLGLPGIGRNTAASIVAFAFNKPVVFIETNIRSVFIHCFFSDQDDVHDREILPLVEQTLDVNNPRDWYSALMDYGVMLKKKLPNPSRKSVHHQVQGKFAGSNRQVRGRIITLLTRNQQLTEAEIIKNLQLSSERVKSNLKQLQQEGFIKKKGRTFSIA